MRSNEQNLIREEPFNFSTFVESGKCTVACTDYWAREFPAGFSLGDSVETRFAESERVLREISKCTTSECGSV